MTINEAKSANPYHVVGPIDKLIRGAIGFLILISSFGFPLTIFEMSGLFGLTIYFWVTSLTNWDPFYIIFLKLHRHYKFRAVLNGRF